MPRRTPHPLLDPDHHAEGYDSGSALAGLVEGFEQIPAHLRRPITFDQGSEWARWPDLTATYRSLDCHSPATQPSQPDWAQPRSGEF